MSDRLSDVESTTPAAAEKKPEREGLPPGYRMRADAHYVEQLTSRRADRVYTDQPRGAALASAKDAETPASEPDLRERREFRDRRGDRVLAQVAEELATVESASAMLTGQSAGLAQRVTLDLVRSHTARASWLLRAQAILDGAHRGQVKARQIGTLLGQVRDGLAAECRLAGISLQIHATDWNTAIAVDEHEFVAGLTGAVMATMGLVAQAEGAAIRLSATASPEGGLQMVEVAQDTVPVSSASGARFFDLSWTDRPGGWLAALGSAAARAVVQRDGGTATFLASERRGSAIRLVFGTGA